MFMPREQTNYEQDTEMLEMNMVSITHELSELMVGTAPTVQHNCMQPVESRAFNLASGSNRLMVPILEHAYFSNTMELHCPLNAIHRQSKEKAENGIQALLENTNSTSLGAVRKQRAHSVDMGTVESAMPKPFPTGARYKRRASAADVEQPEALLCAAIDDGATDKFYACLQTSGRRTSMRRKFPRTEPNQPVDYDSVVIDLKAIGLSTENKITNDVMRLFSVFRKFHYYLNDVVPTPIEPDLTDYPSQFVKPTAVMPCTMNVQSQIKHVIYSANAFCYRLVEKLDMFKLADRDKYIECSRALFVLRKMIKQLEPFKTAEFEHKYGVFVNSFGAAQAKNLEILLTQVISKVRECNINVEVYMWSIQKNMETIDSMPSLETLKKAVAIAGATLKDNSIATPKTKYDTDDIDVERKNVNKANQNAKDSGGNGGGIVGAAFIPAPEFNACPTRFIGV